MAYLYKLFICVVVSWDENLFTTFLVTGHDLEDGHEVEVVGAAAVDLEVSQKVAPGKCSWVFFE